jgi:hypothetical protein
LFAVSILVVTKTTALFNHGRALTNISSFSPPERRRMTYQAKLNEFLLSDEQCNSETEAWERVGRLFHFVEDYRQGDVAPPSSATRLRAATKIVDVLEHYPLLANKKFAFTWGGGRGYGIFPLTALLTSPVDSAVLDRALALYSNPEAALERALQDYLKLRARQSGSLPNEAVAWFLRQWQEHQQLDRSKLVPLESLLLIGRGAGGDLCKDNCILSFLEVVPEHEGRAKLF